MTTDARIYDLIEDAIEDGLRAEDLGRTIRELEWLRAEFAFPTFDIVREYLEQPSGTLQRAFHAMRGNAAQVQRMASALAGIIDPRAFFSAENYAAILTAQDQEDRIVAMLAA